MAGSVARRRPRPARFALAAALALAALPLGGCTESTYCGVPVLEFLFCDPRSGQPSYGSYDSAEEPVADFRTEPATVVAGREVTFVSTSSDPDGFLPGVQSIRGSEWDLDGDGSFDMRSEPDWTVDGFRDQVVHTYASPGTRRVRLAVTDWDGLRGQVVREVVVRASASAQPGEGEARPGGGRARAARRAAPPHAFLARLALGPVTGPRGGRRRARRSGVLRGVRIRGQLEGAVVPDSPPSGPRVPAPPAAVAALLRAPIAGRFDIAANRRRTRQRIAGVAVATLRGRPRGRVCIRLTIVNRRGRAPSGSFRVLGGTGAGARLSGSGRVRAAIRSPETISLGGTLRSRKARRAPLPAACRR